MRTRTPNLANLRALMPKHAVCLSLALLQDITAAAFASASHTGRHARGLLWRKIKPRGPSPPPPSPLYGTIHPADSHVTHLPPPLRQGLKPVAGLTTETCVNSAGPPSARRRLPQQGGCVTPVY